jgi:hypothetical protein
MTIDDTFDGITDSILTIRIKNKGPKNGRATDHVAGVSKSCKGICSRIEVEKPYKGFKVAAFCSRCGHGGTKDGVWIMLKDLKQTEKRGLVCPCCNFRPRQKRTKNKSKL